MSATHEQRDRVRKRVGNCCEYCRIAQSGRLFRFHVDHIIATRHGGADEDDNLCLACYKCNGYKGSNVAALDPITGDATKHYNPRQLSWDDHFNINLDTRLSG